ncbi:MAG: hypothetical protein HY764_02145 [Candidatus Portnoybacteria bacterium]|nr:hypothetical protein [Candidatus Portnoybacteria bacterium]
MLVKTKQKTLTKIIYITGALIATTALAYAILAVNITPPGTVKIVIPTNHKYCEVGSPQIFVFGDSITYGSWDASGGWVQRLREFLDEENQADPNSYCIVFNLGVPANTSTNLVSRFQTEFSLRKDQNAEKIAIFFIGINDSRYTQDSGFQVSTSTFTSNIRKLINQAKGNNAKPIFLSITPVDESKTAPIPWNPNISFTNNNIRQFNKILKSVCNVNGASYIDTYSKFINYAESGLDYKSLLADGLHPNSEGHRIIYETVRDSLINSAILQ